MATMTVREAREVYIALKKLGEKPLAGAIAYKVAKMTKDFKPTAESADEAQQKVLEQCGERSDDYGQWKIIDGKRFDDETKAIMDQQCEIETRFSFKLAELGEKIEPAILVGLDQFVTE